MSNNSGGPAFPVQIKNTSNEDILVAGYLCPIGMITQFPGISIRDFFAAKELAKVQATSICDIPAAYQRQAEHCYRMADAMLAERAK